MGVAGEFDVYISIHVPPGLPGLDVQEWTKHARIWLSGKVLYVRFVHTIVFLLISQTTA